MHASDIKLQTPPKLIATKVSVDKDAWQMENLAGKYVRRQV